MKSISKKNEHLLFQRIAGQARDDAATHACDDVEMHARNDAATQSRRDDTLLTVGFNLRKTRRATSLQSPAGTTLVINQKICGHPSNPRHLRAKKSKIIKN